MGALTQPLSSAPDWDAIARRQAAIYVAGLRPADGPPLPGRALTRAVLEQSLHAVLAESTALSQRSTNAPSASSASTPSSSMLAKL